DVHEVRHREDPHDREQREDVVAQPGARPRHVEQDARLRAHRATAIRFASHPVRNPIGSVTAMNAAASPRKIGIDTPVSSKVSRMTKADPARYPAAIATVVFFVIAIITLPSGAMTDRAACGRITSRSDWKKVSPIARAASA